MFNPEDVGQMLSDQLSQYITDCGVHKAALIEPEFVDDEDCELRLGLNRWGDRGRTHEIGQGPIWTGHCGLDTTEL